MIDEYTGIMIVECDICFMFYFTIFLVGLFPRVYPLYYPLLPLYFPLFTRILVYDSGKWTLWRGVFRLELVRRWVPGLADGSIA